MAIQSYIPNLRQTVQIAVAVIIIALAVKYLPIPANVKALFRI